MPENSIASCRHTRTIKVVQGITESSRDELQVASSTNIQSTNTYICLFTIYIYSHTANHQQIACTERERESSHICFALLSYQGLSMGVAVALVFLVLVL